MSSMSSQSIADNVRILDEDQRKLNWVGMSNLRLPIRYRNGDEVANGLSSTKIFVNLDDPRARGIHMSRSYDLLNEHVDEHILSPKVISRLLEQLLKVHADYATQARVEFACDLTIRRRSLVSGNDGWNYYPVCFIGENLQGTITVAWEVTVLYSSTCPVSASLSRQTIQEQFDLEFGSSNTVSATQVRLWLAGQDGIVATPHGQRSAASVRIRQQLDSDGFPLTAVIDRIENSLGTPVQTAVKRADEREFARLNGQNPMFCEDAARRIAQEFEGDESILDYLIRVDHFESLHAHDAVCIINKGIHGGFRALP